MNGERNTRPEKLWMVDHISYEYGQVARNLGVNPEVIMSLMGERVLPATKVAKKFILVADQDLVMFLKRCLLNQAAGGLKLQVPFMPLSREMEALIGPVAAYLMSRYGDDLLGRIREEVRAKLNSLRKEEVKALSPLGKETVRVQAIGA